jgi:hypothetical protein
MRSEVDYHFVKAVCGDSAAQTPLREGQIGSWAQMPFQKCRNVAHGLLRLWYVVLPFKDMPQPLPNLQINLYAAFSKAPCKTNGQAQQQVSRPRRDEAGRKRAIKRPVNW